MFFHKRRSYFPLVIILLSVFLLVFMFFTLSFKSEKSGSPLEEPIEIPTVSSQAYQTQVKEISRLFEQKLALANDRDAQRAIVEETLTALLALRVPVAYQTAHLQFALALNSMQEALTGEDQTMDAALAQYRATMASLQ